MHAIAFDYWSGEKWIGTYGGLAKYDGNNWKVYKESNSGIPSNYINAIAIDSATKWIGTVGGNVAKFDGNKWQTFDTSNSGLPGYEITDIAVDQEGVVWIGTGGEGLVKYDGNSWELFNPSNSKIPGINVEEVVIDSSGNKWIAMLFKGMAKYDGNQWTVFDPVNSGLAEWSVFDFAIANSGKAWITTNGGLSSYDGSLKPRDRGTYSSAQMIAKNNSFKIYPNPANNRLTLHLPRNQFQTYKLASLTGETLIMGQFKGESVKTIDVSNLSPGVYLLEVKTGNTVMAKKVMVH